MNPSEPVPVTLNGRAVTLPAGADVTAAVAALGRPATGGGAHRGIAVAVNGEVVPRAGWHTALAAGDRVEVLSANQGG